MKLVQKLMSNKLHIIGDIHGEFHALAKLLSHLGYNDIGGHKDNYKIVFVGDLVDRGPDSPAVLRLVKKFIEHGNAQAIIGNHELNILNNEARDGSSWFFESRRDKEKQYLPSKFLDKKDKEEAIKFLSSLPIALENDELRIIHAAWRDSSVIQIADIETTHLPEYFIHMKNEINKDLIKSGLLDLYNEQKALWANKINDKNAIVPYLEGIAEYNLLHQDKHPIRLLTSGVETRIVEPFFVGGSWRFCQRFAWWDEYLSDKPVVIGHYWRKVNEVMSKSTVKDESFFDSLPFNSWHGVKKNVFCVDYSVGARFQERNQNIKLGSNTQLAALSWPDRNLIFEDGLVVPTINYKK